jgi:hypothetical protein
MQHQGRDRAITFSDLEGATSSAGNLRNAGHRPRARKAAGLTAGFELPNWVPRVGATAQLSGVAQLFVRFDAPA